MAHPVVEQLRFARSEFARSLRGVGEEDARRRLEPMNSLGWMVGHLAAQEQRYWLVRQGRPPAAPAVETLCGYGRPANAPPLAEMWRAWRAITAEDDPFLDALGAADLLALPPVGGPPPGESVGTVLLRVAAHYWFHNGEAQAVRQLLGHQNLPDFVGAIGKRAPYRPGPQ